MSSRDHRRIVSLHRPHVREGDGPMAESAQGRVEAEQQLVEPVLRLRDRYRSRADRGVLFFRVSGTVLVVVGAIMPVLAIADYPFKAAAVAAAGITMSLSSSLHAFFRWDRQWQILRAAQFRLDDSYMEWRLRVHEAGGLPDGERETLWEKADRELLKRYQAVRQEESEGFFSLLDFPARTAPRGMENTEGSG